MIESLKPVGKRILAKKVKIEAKKSALILLDSAEKDHKLQVVSLGSEAQEQSQIQVGNFILVEKYSGQEVMVAEEAHLILRLDDVIAVIE